MERDQTLSELDAAWAEALLEAEKRARAAGRGDVVDYLALRAANDLARSAGINWLLETFTALAGEANRAGASINLSTQDAHRFRTGNSTMVGRSLTLRAGVRALTVEAGWPRTPRDGIVRGGGLACANINHFGDRKASEELLLVKAPQGAPQWIALGTSGARTQFVEERVRRHIMRLLNRV